METDAEGQVESREYEQGPESLQQQRHQADLEHVGVEHHQEDDDHVEQDGNVLDAANTVYNILSICITLNNDYKKVLCHMLREYTMCTSVNKVDVTTNKRT